MPTQGSQVYWHQLPEKTPPWRNAAELRTCIQESRQAATSILQAAWDGQHHSGRKRPRLLSEHERRLQAAKQRRRAIVQQLEDPHIHRGVVPEPHATPLRVVNLIMEHLGQPIVSHAEADAAVDKIVTNYNALTQQSQSQAGLRMGGRDGRTAESHQNSDGGAPTRRSRRRQRRLDPVAAASKSVLSQTQPTDTLHGTQPTSSQNPRRHGVGLATDMQNSLLLDVVCELCGPRALRFKRLSRADLGSMNWRVTSVEAVPHRRVVLLADRRDPYFAVLFGLARGVTPEPYVVATLQQDGRTPDSLPRYSRTEVPFTQVVCVAPAPVPWRRVWKNISVSAFRNEFAAAVVEVETEESDKGSRGASADAHNVKGSSDIRASFANSKAPHRSSHNNNHRDGSLSEQQLPRGVTLLGDDGEDDDDAEDELLPPTAATAAHPSHVSGSTGPTSPLDITKTTTMESKWINTAPMFEKLAPLMVHSSSLYGYGNMTDEDGGQLDPLQRLPRTEARDRMANAKLRVWYRRLLPRPMAAELMGRLREMNNED
ncbi:putative class I transcription factor A subunit 2 [Leptomonas pyrrhocoris]|uniref:Putative class I transcription factor A subunit 2 n=1 Tax=Leptomonas pyrrhocoris TaxID=157538 RepID=A0A0M9GAZ0_LEPPY|nr:putative class I transcription factor A subunit 2 [Leptomonas pyrrhocoris]XP_015664785.1 putative class I transcription factor A subunit 2 [Leptomonas pyrrhocoris]XP_015664786.1 putative class I transcription factor A subunit 2 [Leptomonas pyrrhocoris]KPA86345.1 putative class I transcription factor A subunit 2 [Leptomonas pyrrhocoris]KPA86346.1 putative class I transcription factor A subunit 2 [Leptomonas pyrrhocoris]KPA86347.1 putative class I transcription factor A subunit 2 [Leptomonas |eukprot:XP_015664784.1 putative class I transcription factor A subunit 2 [Leptomonas pyrrhocoris]